MKNRTHLCNSISTCISIQVKNKTVNQTVNFIGISISRCEHSLKRKAKNDKHWHSNVILSSTGHLFRGRYFYREIIEPFVFSRWSPRDSTWIQHLDKQKTLFWHSFRMTKKLTTADVYLAYCGDLFLSENWYKWGCDFHWRILWIVAVTTGKTSKRIVGIQRHLFQRKILSQRRIRKH